MFLGHFAVALAAKRATPEVSLGTLFFAAQLADLLWPTLVLLGVERFEVAPGITAASPLDFIDYPWSHSLLALAIWGIVLGIAYGLATRARLGAALLLALLVLSHWVLDFASHRPDLPLTPGGDARVGLGLWNSVPATLAVELALFAAGVWLYARGTRSLDAIGRWGFIALVAFLLLVFLLNVFGPPPPGPTAVAWSAHAIWLLVAWAWWIDRHRGPASGISRRGSVERSRQASPLR